MDEEPLNKRAAALRATLELISEQGFHATPMSQIAQRANIGVGTIYRSFDSKETLLNALYLDIKERLARYILQNYSAEVSVREGFRQIFGNVLRYFLEHPMELLFVEQYENSPLIAAATREAGLRLGEPAKELFKRAVDEKLLKEAPVEMLGALLSGALISLVKLHLSGTVKLDEAMLAVGLDAVWDAIKR